MKNEQTKGKAPLTKILPAALAALLLLMSACSNLFDPPDNSAAKGGEGLFSLSIASGQTGRTILPKTVQSDFLKYELVFKSPGKTDVSVDRTNADLPGPVSLPTGTWELKVTAYMDNEKEKPAAEGTLSGIAINGGETTEKSLTLKPIVVDGATGTFEWKLYNPPMLYLRSMSMRIEPLSENGTPESTYCFFNTPEGEEIDPFSSNIALNTGYYRVSIIMVAAYDGKVMTIEEVLHVYQNMKSLFDYKT